MTAHITDHLSAYLDGALSAHDLERVQAHLETCPQCLREYGEFRALQGLLRGLPEPALPEGFVDRIHWRLQREAAEARPRLLGVLAAFRPFRMSPLRLALACVTLLLILSLPLARLSGRFGVREGPLDTDVYLHDYLVLSAGRALTDEVATTFVTSDVLLPEPPIR